MDSDLEASLDEVFISYKDQEKIDKIIKICKTIRDNKINCHDFLLGCFYGASMYVFDSFALIEGRDEMEFNEKTLAHIKDLELLLENLS